MKPVLVLLAFLVSGLSCGHSSQSSHSGPHSYQQDPGHQHRFHNPGKWAKRFESSERDAWQQPERVIDWLELQPDSIVADVGSATGYFPVRIAKEVPQGRVWGVDIEPSMVAYLNGRATEEGLANLKSVLGKPDDPLIPEPVDVVLVVNTYHHIQNRVAYLKNLQRYLKPKGRVVIVDFKKGDLPVGPPDAMKLSSEEIESDFAQAGYSIMSAHEDDLPYQYVIVFTADVSALSIGS